MSRLSRDCRLWRQEPIDVAIVAPSTLLGARLMHTPSTVPRLRGVLALAAAEVLAAKRFIAHALDRGVVNMQNDRE